MYQDNCSPAEANVSDSPPARREPTQRVIAVDHHHEIVYWTIVLGVPEATLYAAVAAVGTSRDAINAWLKSNR